MKKETQKLDSWCKDIAPSTALRTWFGHRPDRFAEFAKRYRAELDANPSAVAELKPWLHHGRMTLVYGARDPALNQAVVLRDYLLGQ